MDTNIELAAYAVGGFLLPGVVSSTLLSGQHPSTMNELRQKLGMVAIGSVVAGVLAAMADKPDTRALGVGVAISGGLLALAALKIPQTNDKPQMVAGNVAPLINCVIPNIPR